MVSLCVCQSAPVCALVVPVCCERGLYLKNSFCGRALGSVTDHDPLGGGRARRTPRAPLFPGSGARAHTQRRCPLTPRTAHHTPLVAVLQSAARARCTGPTCGRRYERRGSPRGSAPTSSNAPPWHRGADDQAQRMTPGKRSRASTTAAGRRAAPSLNEAMAGAPRPRAPFVTMPTARGRRPASTRLDSDTVFRGQGRGAGS